MGPTPAKVGRIIARDTQTTWPDPWSIGICIYAKRFKVLSQWTWDQSLLTVDINTITRWAVKELPKVD